MLSISFAQFSSLLCLFLESPAQLLAALFRGWRLFFDRRLVFWGESHILKL